ncbi:zinc finger protein on ecdysone puffs-like [Littorina saxatilis]|uniref:Matrin-type domain-containing protein n=1 Tax=Littorina saxatilis TaxID=31220 RepID=A0AAN9AWA9_9CAEN
MNRGMRDGGGRSRMGSSDYGGMRNYGSQGGGGGGGYGSQGVMGTSPPGLLGTGLGGAGGYGMGGGGGGGGGGYEMETLLQQRALQQQLSLRESQLALANSLLQQQQQSQQLMDGPGMGMRGGPGPLGMGGLGGMGGGGMMMNKRRQDLRHDDFQPDFKRPRGDFRSQPRDRNRGRDSDAGNRGNSRRNQSSSSSRPNRNSDRDTSGKGRKDSKEEYDPEQPTADDEEQKIEGDPKYHCHVCNTSCRDDEGFRRHMNSSRHKDRMLGMLSLHEEKSVQIASRMKAEKHLRNLENEDKKAQGFCKVCDVVLTNMRYPEHQRMTFHKKRVMQVTKGCGWCNVATFKNFTEVLAHRETKEHKKNQKAHDKKEGRSSRGRKDTDRRTERKDSKPVVKKREPIRVEMPASLAKFDPEVAVGQTCVIPVSGFFCKLCNKFYNNETAAKDTHCKTEAHYAKYKRFVYAKLKAKAEADRDAKEKAEAEEAKKEEAAAAAKAKKAKNGAEETTNKDSSLEESKQDSGAQNADDDKEEGMEEGGDEGKEEEVDKNGQEEDEEEEEEDENAMLSADGTGLDFMDDDAEMEEDNLLNDTEENNAYQTADNTIETESAAETGEGGDQSVDESGFSITAGESTTQLLQESSQEDSLAADDTKDDEEDAAENENESEEPDDKRATRANVSPRSTSTPTRGRGRGGAANRARRGRKTAK